MKLVRAHIIVEGLVQGVYFRGTTVEVAAAHGATGWIRNNPDGTVEAVVEGDEPAVKKVLDWCYKGPPMANVTNVKVQWDEYKDEFDKFTPITGHSIL